MKILSLFITNHKTGWHLNEVLFNNLTLLVGASGVGKSQILNAILKLSQIARGASTNGLEWKVEFSIHDDRYTWEGEFETADNQDELNVKMDYFYEIIWEKVSRNGKKIIVRDKENLVYNDTPTIKLDIYKSAIELLKQEDDIAPIYTAFRNVYVLDTENRGIKVSPVMNDWNDSKTKEEIKRLRRLSPLEKLFLLRKNNNPMFQEICESFIDIFPMVKQVDFTTGIFFDDRTFPVLQIKEHDEEDWILQSDISSGMFRTLSMLVTLKLAEDGDIILIDEFENGLGVNCINELAEMIKLPDADVQIVMTSHHPYIINTMPYAIWKIVTRRAGDVRVYTASELNIGEHSKHDAFIQLLQSTAYQEGRI